MLGKYLFNDTLAISDSKIEIKAVDNFGATDIISIESSQGLLDIPFVKQYFDMSFDSSSSEIRLIVDPDLFSDCWEKPT